MRLAVEARVRRGAFTLETRIESAGDALGIVGPSGSGKSTLLEAIAGIEPGARVVLDGRDLSRLPIHRREMGYVTQDALLFPHLTVRENLRFPVGARPVDDIVATLGIEALLDRAPRNLSGGERRRVSLARALAARPKLLLLDEPFAGLDAARRRDAMSLLDLARRRFGVPIVLVSHVAEEVLALTDTVVRLEEGRVTAAGPSTAVLRGEEARRLDNLFTGRVSGPDRVRVGDAELFAALPEGAAGDVRLACYAHDVLLALEIPRAISARNRIPARVAAVDRAGDAVVVTLAALPLRATVTPEAARELDLRPGAEVVAIVKAAAIACLGPAAAAGVAG